MGVFAGPNIVEDGLVLAVDASNTKSYPGSGTTWFDISGNGNDATLNSVTHSSANGGVFVLGGSSSSFIDNNTINLVSSDFTVFCASRHTNTGNNGRLVGGRNNNFLVGHWWQHTESMFAQGWVGTYANNVLASAQNSTDWRIYHGCGDISGDSYDFYVNDRTNATGSNGGAAGPNGLIIGKTLLYSGGDYESAEGEVSFVYYYNRVLSADEVKQNYEATRGRFGL